MTRQSSDVVTNLPCSKGRGDELVVVVVVVVVVGEREGGTQERGRNGDRGWQCPRRSSVGGRRTRASYGPTQNCRVDGVCLGCLAIAWTGLGVDRHNARSPKKKSSVGGDTHPPIAAPLSIIEGEWVTLGPVGRRWCHSAMQGVAQRTKESSSSAKQTTGPPPTPWPPSTGTLPA